MVEYPTLINPAETKAQLQRAKMRYQSIRGYYLKKGKTEAEWNEVCADPRKFNRVWREMLQIPPGDRPPPEAFRR